MSDEPETWSDLYNHLVEYKGGGYNGCWWEWNYFMWDHEGNWINLLTTGRKGVKDEYEAKMLVREARLAAKRQDRTAITRLGVNIWNLGDREEMLTFVDEMNGSNACALDQSLRALDLGLSLSGHCSECGKEQFVSYMDPTNWRGDGHGVTYSGHDLMCASCAREEEVIE